jgi:hypothetical protein
VTESVSSISGLAPHFAHNFWSAEATQCVSNGVQVIVEEIGVDVESHRRGGVAEHALHCFDVRSGRYCEARGGVAQVVHRRPQQFGMVVGKGVRRLVVGLAFPVVDAAG